MQSTDPRVQPQPETAAEFPQTRVRQLTAEGSGFAVGVRHCPAQLHCFTFGMGLVHRLITNRAPSRHHRIMELT